MPSLEKEQVHLKKPFSPSFSFDSHRFRLIDHIPSFPISSSTDTLRRGGHFASSASSIVHSDRSIHVENLVSGLVLVRDS